MTETVLSVEGMSCDHCANAIVNAVGALPGVSIVSVDLSAKRVATEYDPSVTTVDEIKYEIEDLGYEVVMGT